MKILVVGAGAIGGYFGGRLLEKGEDVTFLVREKRKQQIEDSGLIIDSVHGGMTLTPKLVTKKDKSENYDVIMLSNKAYHLHTVIEDIRPFVSEGTMILPLLNGISHLDLLIKEFGEERVIGGLCFIETTLAANGKVVQTSPIHHLVFGERNGEETDRIIRLRETFSNTKASFIYSDHILEEMWKKYLFISVLSGATTLMRAPIGPIRETLPGFQAIQAILQEVILVMEKMGAPIGQELIEVQLHKIKEMNDEMKSSMQRDMEKGLMTEADHFFKYLLEHAEVHGLKTPYLEVIYANLKVYEKKSQGLEK